jgi:hypothetical protein
MAFEGKPSYLKAAFLNVYNLSLLGGAAVVSAASGDWVVGAVALGAEALWLLFGPDFKPFQRAVNQSAREDQDKADRARVKQLTDKLPEREWARAHALDELRREIERDMQVNPTFQAILLQSELDKMQRLHIDFVSLATSCTRAETYLAATDLKDLNRQLESQRTLEKSLKDPAAQEIARKNAVVLERRIHTISEIQNFLGRARGQMTLIENSVRLLRDQVLTMQSPEALGEQLDDLLTGVEAIQASAKDNEAILSKIQLEPIAEVAGPEAGAVKGSERLRS